MAEESHTHLPPEDDVRLIDLLLVVAENARLIAVGSIGAGLVALVICFLIPPTFTAVATVLPPQQQQSTTALLASQLGALAGVTGLSNLPGIKNPGDLYVGLVKSRTIAERIVDRFDLVKVYDEDLRSDAIAELRDATRVTAAKEGLIIIEVDDKDPKRAADIANAYTAELSRLMDGLATTEARQRRMFFEKELKKVHQSLSEAQLKLGEAGVPESVVKSSPAAMLESVARLRALVTAQEIKISTMSGFLTEQSPDVQLARRELASLRAQLALAERDQPLVNGKGAEYLNRYRDFKYQETLFQLLANQYESSRLDEAREAADIQRVDVAQPPERRSKPKRTLTAILTTLAAALFLVLFALVRAALRNASAAPEVAGKLARIGAGFRHLVGRRTAK